MLQLLLSLSLDLFKRCYNKWCTQLEIVIDAFFLFNVRFHSNGMSCDRNVCIIATHSGPLFIFTLI